MAKEIKVRNRDISIPSAAKPKAALPVSIKANINCEIKIDVAAIIGRIGVIAILLFGVWAGKAHAGIGATQFDKYLSEVSRYDVSTISALAAGIAEFGGAGARDSVPGKRCFLGCARP